MTIFSVDCEFTGRYPIRFNLLSVGVVAFSDEGEELETWYSAIPNSQLVWDPNTLAFWHEQGDTFTALMEEVVAVTKILRPSDMAFSLQQFVLKYNQSGKFATFLADPCNADFPWIDTLFGEAGYDNPFGYKGLCLGSMIRQQFGLALYDKVRDTYVSAIPHHALEDARAQGKCYFDLKNRKLEINNA